MVKVKLEVQYLWNGVFYGPGVVNVPSMLAEVYNLTPIEATKAKPKSD